MKVNCANAKSIGQPDAVRCLAKKKVVRLRAKDGCIPPGGKCDLRQPGAFVQITVERRPPIWPPFAKKLKAVKAEGETGVGDTAAREVARLGLVEFQTAYGIRFGPSCGCMAKEWGAEARAAWNKKWSYAPSP